MINKAILLGRVGKKDFKPTKNGSVVCNLSIATNKKYMDSHGQQRQMTNWHHVHLFNKLAEISNKYAHVGDLVYIEGEINNKKVEESGITKVFSSITANLIQFIPTSRKTDSLPADMEPSGERNSMQNEVSPIYDDESISF